MKGECRAHGHLGAVHLSLGNFIHATKCYSEQLASALDVKDAELEAAAHGNLGLTKSGLGRHEEAIGCFEAQLAALQQREASANGQSAVEIERARAFGNLGGCYEALSDHEEAVKCHEQYLALALKAKAVKDQARAYRELGLAHKNLGNLQQALVSEERV